jgi:hypothetical protein
VSESLAEELAELPKLNRSQLQAKWRPALKQSPPSHLRKQLLVPPPTPEVNFIGSCRIGSIWARFRTKSIRTRACTKQLWIEIMGEGASEAQREQPCSTPWNKRQRTERVERFALR